MGRRGGHIKGKGLGMGGRAGGGGGAKRKAWGGWGVKTKGKGLGVVVVGGWVGGGGVKWLSVGRGANQRQVVERG